MYIGDLPKVIELVQQRQAALDAIQPMADALEAAKAALAAAQANYDNADGSVVAVEQSLMALGVELVRVAPVPAPAPQSASLPDPAPAPPAWAEAAPVEVAADVPPVVPRPAMVFGQ